MKRLVVLALLLTAGALAQNANSKIGREVAVENRLQDGDEYQIPLASLLEYGRRLFVANWTIQEGAGRPLSKGTGDPLSDLNSPLVFPRSGNRLSGPEANSCAGCHNSPYPGGGGDLVANVFVLGQRFDSLSFDSSDTVPTRGAVDETGKPVTLNSAANSRITIGMFGSGYIEMLARQITADLQSLRDATPPGGSQKLMSKGISFGTIVHNTDGTWDVSQVEGIPTFSLSTTGTTAPSLLIRPFHQAGRVVSLREFTNNAFNHHHGMQSVERFGANTDPDGDGVMNELNRADITATTVFQATLPVPGQVLPSDFHVLAAVNHGQQKFMQIGCGSCHTPMLPLDKQGWIYTEPNPYNPLTNLQVGDAPTFSVDLTSDALPGPRLKPDKNGVVWVPAFTDMKLHDICAGPDDPNIEGLDMQAKPGSVAFFAGNRKFMTRRLWGAGNTAPYFHHGKYTTMREAILAHMGEAQTQNQAFQALTPFDQDSIIEFLKSLQVLPLGETRLVISRAAMQTGSLAARPLQTR